MKGIILKLFLLFLLSLSSVCFGSKEEGDSPSLSTKLAFQNFMDEHLKLRCQVQKNKKDKKNKAGHLYAFGETHTATKELKWRGKVLSLMIKNYLDAGLSVIVADEGYMTERLVEYSSDELDAKLKYLSSVLYIDLSELDKKSLSYLTLTTWESKRDQDGKFQLKDKLQRIRNEVHFLLEDPKTYTYQNYQKLCLDLEGYDKDVTHFLSQNKQSRNRSLVEKSKAILQENPQGLNLILAGADHLNENNKNKDALFEDSVEIFFPDASLIPTKLQYNETPHDNLKGLWSIYIDTVSSLARLRSSLSKIKEEKNDDKNDCFLFQLLQVRKSVLIQLIKEKVVDCDEEFNFSLYGKPYRKSSLRNYMRNYMKGAIEEICPR